jgi:hypothetical protein
MSEVATEAAALKRWLFDMALPLWWKKGADRVGGGFHEANGHQNLITQSGTQLSDRVPANGEKNLIGNRRQPSASIPEPSKGGAPATYPARLGVDHEASSDVPIFCGHLQPILKLHTLMTTRCTINQTTYAHFWRAAIYSVREKLIR